MQTRPNSPETLPTILDGACAHPSPQLLTGLTLAPRADAFNDVLPPPLPQMRDGGDLRFYVVTSNWHLRLFRVLHLHPITSATSLTLRCVSHPVSAPHPCAPTSTSIPSALHQFPSLFSATTPPCHVPASASLHRSPQTRAEGFFL